VEGRPILTAKPTKDAKFISKSPRFFLAPFKKLGELGALAV
jgi:hypothetical protein